MRRSRGLLRALALVVLGSAVCAACTGPDTPSGGDAARPPERTGPVVPVDACDLVGRPAMRRALHRPVRVVGRELEAPTLPTQTCLWGREFGVALVDVQLTPGPVARRTFEAAFGPAAGDDPRPAAVGQSAYARDGLTSRTLQVFDHGVVLSLEARDAPGNRLPHRALADVAEAALRDLPANPRIGRGRPRPPCGRVDEDAVAAAMRTDVRMRTAFVGGRAPEPDRPAMCSWAGLPGQVVVTLRTNPVQVTNFRANLSPRVYARVPGVPAETWSQNDHAGDLLIFLDDAMVEVTTLPGQGFSSQNVATTRGEKRLATDLVRVFG